MAIEAIEEKPSSTNKPMLKITYNCVMPGLEGRKAWHNIVDPDDKGSWQLALLLVATGDWTEEDLIGKDVAVDYPDLIGKHVGVILVPATYNGQATVNVKQCIPVDQVTGPVDGAPATSVVASAPGKKSATGGGRGRLM
jgi:hypothetical protein